MKQKAKKVRITEDNSELIVSFDPEWTIYDCIPALRAILIYLGYSMENVDSIFAPDLRELTREGDDEYEDD